MAAPEPVVLPAYVDRVKLDGEYVYDTFAGVDIIAQIVLPNESKPLLLGELQTISYSIHRENKPVRTIGHVNASGFVKGPRTIAGSLIFTVFNSYAFYRLDQFRDLVYRRGRNIHQMYPLADMLPPFDIILTLSNEYGRFAKMRIYGVTIVDEGGTMSIDDLVTEQTYTYMARGMQPLTAYVPDSSSPVPVKYTQVAQQRTSMGILDTTLVQF